MRSLIHYFTEKRDMRMPEAWPNWVVVLFVLFFGLWLASLFFRKSKAQYWTFWALQICFGPEFSGLYLIYVFFRIVKNTVFKSPKTRLANP